MSNMIEIKNILETQERIVGKKCDICGKEIPPTVIPHIYGEPVYDYYEITTHHNDWGNDSVESYEYFDACSPECANKLCEKYICDSAGKMNTKCIEVKHVNCWSLEYHDDDIVRCKDCKWYSSETSWCNNLMSPKEQTFFCADGKKR